MPADIGVFMSPRPLFPRPLHYRSDPIDLCFDLLDGTLEAVAVRTLIFDDTFVVTLDAPGVVTISERPI